ncbi:hypothetical protein BKA07_001743 [Brevibacterium marinum]|uniref:Uncharacterized protein n=1 Tax=Brevibacterium marinum TaxID=418643 RepID=A0A846S0V8_9MICO|nr:hypothetical protein [Brevibacterium marinum]
MVRLDHVRGSAAHTQVSVRALPQRRVGRARGQPSDAVLDPVADGMMLTLRKCRQLW